MLKSEIKNVPELIRKNIEEINCYYDDFYEEFIITANHYLIKDEENRVLVARCWAYNHKSKKW